MDFLHDQEVPRKSTSNLDIETNQDSHEHSHLAEEEGLNEGRDNNESTNGTVEQVTDMSEVQGKYATGSRPGAKHCLFMSLAGTASLRLNPEAGSERPPRLRMLGGGPGAPTAPFRRKWGGFSVEFRIQVVTANLATSITTTTI
ncbi:hypothetical protein O3P69_004680 [Scylla paramamosain]|uniref:Uncharacterized protein n=1 Tax=Scylla paramamosain TaxID=85552 RepID=A0AAW0UBT1_SCYPA